ncbi:hypothetical protein [Hahella sp. HN01]|uniref:hypothetical protein n=1 Tax=Hahella sp. HN01 TaxID=2847262 RepID=UPI001C1E92E3|nr:hypothetical protein [Hahella sp. HN01]MBU6955943.1 hypothetical protein [Hahella sp. HN01]
MSIEEELDQIFSIKMVATDGLPEEIKAKLDGIILEYSLKEILSASDALRVRYIEEEIAARKCMGGSGMGAEFHMAAALRVNYLGAGPKYIIDDSKKL